LRTFSCSSTGPNWLESIVTGPLGAAADAGAPSEAPGDAAPSGLVVAAVPSHAARTMTRLTPYAASRRAVDEVRMVLLLYWDLGRQTGG
jgi:hypothetical protein